MSLSLNVSDRYSRRNIVKATSLEYNGSWLVRAEVTNLSDSNEENRRGYLREDLMDRDGRTIRVLEPEHLNAIGDGALVSTTESQRWTALTGFHDEDAASTINALEYGRVEKLKVQESDFLAVLALVLLPAVLSIFPLALFQDASLPAVFAYAAATDVFSVLPLTVKGVELLFYGSRKHYAHITNISGVNHSQAMSYVSTWVSECEMKPKVCRRGVVVHVLAPRWVKSYRLPRKEISSSMYLKLNVSDRYRKCNRVQVTGLKHNGSWLVRVQVTNLTGQDGGGRRGYLQEDLMLTDGRIVQLRRDLHGCVENRTANGDGELTATRTRQG